MERWWQQDADVLLLGVFQGGGAKGVAYGGALQAVAAHGMWFSQVAGASAGAITAAMVAAGVHPDELDRLTSEAMRRVHRQVFRLVAGSESLLSTERLGDWLDEQLRARVRGAGACSPSGVTFSELEEASGIGCHVVALDLATGNPVVFSGALTPSALVVEAVLASSAIPGALNAGRAAIQGTQPGDPIRVHHLIDGGAWANYPTFVFREPGFRAWAYQRIEDSGKGESSEAVHNLESDTTSAPLLGFVLDSPPERPMDVVELRGRRWRYYPEADLGTGRSAASLPSFIVSMLLGPKAARLITALAVLALIAIGLGFVPEVIVDLNEIAFRNFEWWGGGIVGGAASLFVLLVSLFFAGMFLATLLFGRAIAYSGLPAARALLGVATGVPPWAHQAPQSLVLNLRSHGLTTLSFRAKDEKRRQVVATARADATHQLRAAREQLTSWGVSPERFSSPLPEVIPAVTARPGRLTALVEHGGPWIWALILTACVVFLGWGIGFVVTSILGKDPFEWSLLGLVVLLYVAIVVVRVLSHRAQMRARGAPPFRTTALAGLAALILVLAAASLLSAHAAPERVLVDAVVENATRAGEGPEIRYSWTDNDREGHRGELITDLSFRVGEHVLLEPLGEDGYRWGIATPGPNVFETLFFPLGFGLAAIVTLYFLADEVHYRRFRSQLTRPSG